MWNEFGLDKYPTFSFSVLIYQKILQRLRKKTLPEIADKIITFLDVPITTQEVYVKAANVETLAQFHNAVGLLVRKVAQGHFLVKVQGQLVVCCIIHLFPKFHKYTSQIKIGELVRLKFPRGARGLVAWIDMRNIDEDSHGRYDLGVRLTERLGNCDGSHNDRRYFQCDPLRGLFCTSENVTHVIRYNMHKQCLDKIRFRENPSADKLHERTAMEFRKQIQDAFNSPSLSSLIHSSYVNAAHQRPGLCKNDFLRIWRLLQLSMPSMNPSFWWKSVIPQNQMFMNVTEYSAFLFQILSEEIHCKTKEVTDKMLQDCIIIEESLSTLRSQRIILQEETIQIDTHATRLSVLSEKLAEMETKEASLKLKKKHLIRRSKHQQTYFVETYVNQRLKLLMLPGAGVKADAFEARV